MYFFPFCVNVREKVTLVGFMEESTVRLSEVTGQRLLIFSFCVKVRDKMKSFLCILSDSELALMAENILGNSTEKEREGE